MTSCHSAIDTVNESYPYYAGRHGILGQRSSNQIIQECDLLLVLGSRLILKTTGYSQNDEVHLAQLSYGNMIHFLLAEIDHPSEIDLILDRYEISITQALLDKQTLKNKLESVYRLPKLQPYFDGSYTLKKEASILNNKGEVQRPDLIAIKDKTAAIIDYKTGEPRSGYAEQLAGYSALLHQMGFEVKACLLVYVDSEEVESV